MMDIFFCGRCNQSIPVADLEDRTAGFEQGELLCREHFSVSDSVSSTNTGGSSTGQPVRRSGVLVGAFVGLLMLIMAGAGFAGAIFLYEAGTLVLENKTQGTEALDVAMLRDVKAQLRSLDGQRNADLQWTRTTFEGITARLDSMEGALRTLDGSMVFARDTNRKDREELLEAMALDRTEIGGIVGQMDLIVDRLAEIEDRLASGSLVQPPIVDDSGKPATRGPGVVARGNAKKDVDPTSTPPPEEDPPNPLRDQWIRALKSTDPGARFTALVELTGIGGKKAGEAISGLLTDEDPFLRSYAAHSLGRLEAWGTVSRLIDALTDAEVSVRQAVFEALNQITGQRFAFKADAASSDRKKSIRKWREWWKDQPQNQES